MDDYNPPPENKKVAKARLVGVFVSLLTFELVHVLCFDLLVPFFFSPFWLVVVFIKYRSGHSSKGSGSLFIVAIRLCLPPNRIWFYSKIKGKKKSNNILIELFKKIQMRRDIFICSLQPIWIHFGLIHFSPLWFIRSNLIEFSPLQRKSKRFASEFWTPHIPNNTIS